MATQRWVLLAAITASVVSLFPALLAPRYVDDFYLHARIAGKIGPPTTFGAYEFFESAEQVRTGLDNGMLPWWTDPSLQIRFFRPLTSATHAFDVAVFGGSAIAARMHSLVWLAALIAGAWLLFRRWSSPAAAILSLSIYAIAGHHALPSAWLAARHALVSGVFGCVAIWAWLRWKEDGVRTSAPLWLAASMLALAGGEVGVGVPLVCATHALLARPDRKPLDRIRDALPAAALLAIFVGGYAALGFGARGSEAYVDPVTAPAEFLYVAAGRWLAMLAQLTFGVAAEFYIAAVARPVLWSLGALGVVLLLVAWRTIGVAELRTRPPWLAVASVLALLPAGAAVPGGRALPLSALGSTALVAALTVHAIRRVKLGDRPRSVGLFAIGLLAMGQLVISPLSRWMLAAGVRQGAEQERRIAARWSAPCAADELRVLVSAPDFAAGIYTPLQLALERGEPIGLFRLISMAPIDLRIARRGDRTLGVEASPGNAFFQSQWEQLHSRGAPGLGYEGAHVGLRVRVTAVDALRRPSELEVHTRDPLDSICWLAWDGTTFERVRLPRASESLIIPTRPGPLAVPGIERR